MKKIIVSCPYGDLKELEIKIKNSINDNDLLISVKDIIRIDDSSIYLKDSSRHAIDSFTKSYIRYPYDLIEPHTKTYKKREDTEFIKTLAILLNDKSVNNFLKAHFGRNRLFSMKVARECGFETPRSVILKNNLSFNLDKSKISKSLGNCYFSEHISKKDEANKDILSFEKDGDESAYVYNPHIIKTKEDIERHINLVGTLLIQDFFKGDEYRLYVVDKDIFVYKRKKINSIDQSSADLVEVDKDELNKFNKHKIKFLDIGKKLGLQYFCLDLIFYNDPIIIDINPYGSYPTKNGEKVINALANLILK